MRTVFARFVALCAVLAITGCTGGSAGTGVSSPVGGIGSGNGANGNTGGGNEPAANNTATVTCTAFPCQGGDGLILQSITLPTGAGVTVTSVTLQVSSVATGAPALPSGSCSNSGTACLIVSGTIVLSGAPAVNGSPTLVFSNTNWPIPGHTTIKGAFINASAATVTSTGAFNAQTATIPSVATFTWPLTNSTTYTVYVT